MITCLCMWLRGRSFFKILFFFFSRRRHFRLISPTKQPYRLVCTTHLGCIIFFFCSVIMCLCLKDKNNFEHHYILWSHVWLEMLALCVSCAQLQHCCWKNTHDVFQSYRRWAGGFSFLKSNNCRETCKNPTKVQPTLNAKVNVFIKSGFVWLGQMRMETIDECLVQTWVNVGCWSEGLFGTDWLLRFRHFATRQLWLYM